MNEGWLTKGLRVWGKHELIRILRAWLSDSSASTIGDTDQFHGAFWVTVVIGRFRVKLTADTTRDAVQRVVDYASAHPERPWRVVTNSRGRINKVVVIDRDDPGWYAYIAEALPSEIEI